MYGKRVKPTVIAAYLDKLGVAANPTIAERWRTYLLSQGATGNDTYDLEVSWLKGMGYTGKFSDMVTNYIGSKDDVRSFFAGGGFGSFAASKFANLPSADGTLKNVTLYGLSTQAGTPTPDAPVPIVSTTGNVTVRSNSKNLFDGGVGITTGFYYDSFGTAIASAADYIQTAYIPVLPNTTYTMSHSGSANPKVLQYTSGQTFISRSVTIGGTSVTFTTTSNTAFVRLSSATAQLATTQLELGSVATAFVPHNVTTQTLPLGSTQLRSLPNGVSDRIYKDGSTWKLEQNVKTVTLNGSQTTIVHSTTDPNNVAFRITNTDLKPSGSYNVSTPAGTLSTKLAGQSWYTMNVGAYATEGISVHNANSYFYMVLARSRLTTLDVAGFNTYVAANNIDVNYETLTPITTPITDPTLITALENIRTYQGVTNITASTPVSGSYFKV